MNCEMLTNRRPNVALQIIQLKKMRYLYQIFEKISIKSKYPIRTWWRTVLITSTERLEQSFNMCCLQASKFQLVCPTPSEAVRPTIWGHIGVLLSSSSSIWSWSKLYLHLKLMKYFLTSHAFYFFKMYFGLIKPLINNKKHAYKQFVGMTFIAVMAFVKDH